MCSIVQVYMGMYCGGLYRCMVGGMYGEHSKTWGCHLKIWSGPLDLYLDLPYQPWNILIYFLPLTYIIFPHQSMWLSHFQYWRKFAEKSNKNFTPPRFCLLKLSCKQTNWMCCKISVIISAQVDQHIMISLFDLIGPSAISSVHGYCRRRKMEGVPYLKMGSTKQAHASRCSSGECWPTNGKLAQEKSWLLS